MRFVHQYPPALDGQRHLRRHGSQDPLHHRRPRRLHAADERGRSVLSNHGSVGVPAFAGLVAMEERQRRGRSTTEPGALERTPGYAAQNSEGVSQPRVFAEPPSEKEIKRLYLSGEGRPSVYREACLSNESQAETQCDPRARRGHACPCGPRFPLRATDQ